MEGDERRRSGKEEALEEGKRSFVSMAIDTIAKEEFLIANLEVR